MVVRRVPGRHAVAKAPASVGSLRVAIPYGLWAGAPKETNRCRTHRGRSFSDCVAKNRAPNPDTTGTCRSFSDCVTRNLGPNPDTTGTCANDADLVPRETFRPYPFVILRPI